MSDIEFDFSDLRVLSAELDASTLEVRNNVRKALTVTARNVKDEAARLSSGLAHAPYYPRSITYDVHSSGSSTAPFEAEIGPDKGRAQGALGNILEYGTSKNAPIPHLGPALRANEADFMEGLARAAGDVL